MDILFVHDDPGGWDYWRADLLNALPERFRILWVTPRTLRSTARAQGQGVNESYRGRRTTANWWQGRSRGNFRLGRLLRQALRPEPKPLDDRRWHLDVVNPIPRRAFPGAGRLADRFLAWSIAVAARHLGLRADILWFEHPTYLGLCGLLSERAVVYGSTDEYAAFEGVTGQDAAWIAGRERRIAGRADAILCVSDMLAGKFASYGAEGRTWLIPNGGQAPRSSGAPDEPPAPHGLRTEDRPNASRRPVAGMHGVLNDRINWVLLHDVAKRLPGWSFLLIGPVRDATAAAHLQMLPNVSFLGAKPRAELPRLIRTFDIGLLPYTHSRMNLSCSPLKLYDYLAAGVPAVATSLPQARSLSPPVLIADDAETFVQALEEAYARHDALAAACAHAARRHTWAVRANEVARIFDQLAQSA